MFLYIELLKHDSNLLFPCPNIDGTVSGTAFPAVTKAFRGMSYGPQILPHVKIWVQMHNSLTP